MTNSARLNAISQIASYKLPKAINYKKKTANKLFGSHVFGLPVMKKCLSRKAFKVVKESMANGTPLDQSVADEVAEAMQKWAIKKGATHYGHIFYPLTNFTAEKNDSFYSPDYKGGLITDFDGDLLIQQEPDGSSFPSGGIRDTHEARGYTAWDVTSPAYLVENPNGLTLAIPSAFVSWSGSAMGRKTPLMRSMQALDKQAKRILKLFGHKKIGRIIPTAGAEQEYFLIDRNFYLNRPDLLNAGRSLFGAPSPKGQEFDDHYFGAINERVQAFMYEFEHELFKLGVPVKTRHNEVAPGQYEVAPVYENANVATDHQQIIMTVLQRVAGKYGFACMLHEKPFAGVNGSGKHVNFSLGNSTQGNLLNPGNTPHANAQFLVFCAAFIRAVHIHAPLLRAVIASASNDHRLGANEAPPAIISIFLGSQLTNVFEQIKATGSAKSSLPAGSLEIGVDALPTLPRHSGDRNRTSPFAFTGNKFEFRAVGSSQSVAGPITVINTILSESLDYIADKLESASDFNAAVQAILAEVINEHGAILFDGDGYSDEWHAEAEKRGLPNLRTTPDALPALMTKTSQALFEAYGVYSHAELDAVYEVALEQYIMTVNVESNIVSEMAKTLILPAAIRYQSEVAGAAANLKAAGVKPDLSLVKTVSTSISDLEKAIAALDKIKAKEPADGLKLAEYGRDKTLPAMLAVRGIVDQLETVVADDLWPLPTYQEMLFMR